MKPELSVSTPAAPRLRRSEFGTRPRARSKWLPEIFFDSFPVPSTTRGPASGTAGAPPALDLTRAARLQLPAVALRVLQSRLAEDQLEVRRFLERLLPVAAEALDHGALSLVDTLHVHLHRAGIVTVF